ncbi:MULTISPECIES: DUF4330 family protein [Haloarcula]|uniref:DUF4330 family protein n=1 Tax=Haloarcula TaxID=2237 RepID=UPI0023E8F9AF|nr:DUF4330 family protein [Halomicroarcula sp. SHR3]
MDSLGGPSGGLIDDEGNLFGVVNVVDALVVLLVLAVAVAGIGLVLSGGEQTDAGPETGTAFVTLDLGTQPDYIVTALNEGDTVNATKGSNLTITDLYLAPQGDQTRVIAQVRLQGIDRNDSIDYAGAPPRLGRSLSINTSQYDVKGKISDIGGESSLDSSSTSVVLRQTVSADDASAVTPGDEIDVGGRTAATVEDVAVYPTSNPNRRVLLVEANVSSYTQQGTERFGATALRAGQRVRLPTAEYTINGRIVRVGSGLDTGTTTVLLSDRVSATDASEVTPGDEVSVAGYTAATVEDVAVYPTTNPDRRRVLVEANVSSYTQQDSRRFGRTDLRTGQRMTLPTEEYTIDGRIEQVDTSLQSRALTNRTVTLELSEVSEETANAIRPGQTEQAGTVPTAYVRDVDREPTPIISTAQDGTIVVNDHPTLRDVTLTTELRVSETDGGVEFRGERIQYGSTVVLDLGPVTVRTEVVDIGR